MLHILSKTPLDPAIIERTSTGDTIVLIEDAVIESLASGPYRSHWQRVLKSQRIFVLAADLAVRGLPEDLVLPGMEITDYQGFVQLTVDNDKIHSWN